jgi:hypothetical protein
VSQEWVTVPVPRAPQGYCAISSVCKKKCLTLEIVQKTLLKNFLWGFVLGEEFIEVCGHAMVEAVSSQPPTTEAWVHTWVSPCVICGRQSGTGTGFS